jgi:hypothetical protein
LERIIKLSLEGAGSSDGFLVVMPVNAEFIESGSGNDAVTITSTGDDTSPNYVSLGDGNDRLNLASTGDATSDYWQGSTNSGAVEIPAVVNGKEIAVFIPSGRGIFAGDGNDVVNIAAGRDVYNVYAGEGDDVLTVAAGRDISGIFGGAGRDVLTLAGGMNIDNITGDAGDDIITVAVGNEAHDISGGQGRDIITVAAGQRVDGVSGGQGADIINVASSGAANYIFGGAGDDTIAVAGATVMRVEGGWGDDSIAVNARTADAISGGRGDDRIDLTGTGKAKVFFDRGDGKDVVSVARETTVVFAERSIDDAEISYGDGTITISFADNGDSVTLDYSAAALKGVAPELSFTDAGQSEVRGTAPRGWDASAFYSYFYANDTGGFSLTLR